MQVAEPRIANDNGLVPAGRYFSRLAEGLREANERAAAVVDIYEQQERRVEARYRGKTASPVSREVARAAPTGAKRPMQMVLS